MAELRNGGTSRSAVASSARTAPSASSRPTSVGSSGAIRARMRLCASSTVSVETAARAALGLVGIARSLGGAPDRLAGIVTRVVKDRVAAQVEVQAGPYRLVSLLTREAVDELDLAPGVRVVAAVKATNVVIELPR